MTPARAQAVLDSLSRFGMRFGLDRIHRLLGALGHPERRYLVVHVAGTNGKGSTCAFTESILRAAGRRVGLYTSPHLIRVHERIRVDGAEIPGSALARGLAAILDAYPGAVDGPDPLTYFEALTALGLWHFAKQRVDVAVVETGLGGRLDATNAVVPRVAVVTRIAHDHTAFLGRTLAAIAREKAGIFKPGARLVIARQRPAALDELVRAARGVGERPRVAGRDFALEGIGPYTFHGAAFSLGNLALGLDGAHQRANAEAAIEAAWLVEQGLSDDAIRRGLLGVVWPGRLEVVCEDPLVLLDGAHNPDGARALARAIRDGHPRARILLVLGTLADKDVDGIAAALVPLAHAIHLARPNCDRGLAVESLAARVGALGRRGICHRSVASALRSALAAARREGPHSVVLVAGSLYVVGEAKACFAERPRTRGQR